MSVLFIPCLHFSYTSFTVSVLILVRRVGVSDTQIGDLGYQGCKFVLYAELILFKHRNIFSTNIHPKGKF